MSSSWLQHSRTLVFDVSDLDARSRWVPFWHSKASTDHNLYIRDGFIVSNYSSSGSRSPVQGPWRNSRGRLVRRTPAGSSAGYGMGAWERVPWFHAGGNVMRQRLRQWSVRSPAQCEGVRAKVCLGGAYEQGTGLMRDDPDRPGLVPLQGALHRIGMVLPGGGCDPSMPLYCSPRVWRPCHGSW